LLLTAIRGEPPVPGSRITLRFDETGAGGYGGCNWYGGAYRAEGGEIEWKEMSSTMRACLDQALMEQEGKLLAAMNDVERYRVEGERLLLEDADGSALLEWSRRRPIPMDPAALFGTEWRLESMKGAPPAGRITMRFVDATAIRGFAGCRAFVSRYRAAGDRLSVTETHMEGTECGAPPRVAVEEGDFTTFLSEAEHYRLEGERLEITTAAGVTLVFASTPNRSSAPSRSE
jgi:heat shock protein HslJ